MCCSSITKWYVLSKWSHISSKVYDRVYGGPVWWLVYVGLQYRKNFTVIWLTDDKDVWERYGTLLSQLKCKHYTSCADHFRNVSYPILKCLSSAVTILLNMKLLFFLLFMFTLVFSSNIVQLLCHQKNDLVSLLSSRIHS